MEILPLLLLSKISKASLRLKSLSLERETLAFSRSCSLLQRSFKALISSSSALGISLGPGEPLTGDPPLAPDLAADDPLAGEVFFNGEVYPLVLLADEALPLGGEDGAAEAPPAPGLMKAANSLVLTVASPSQSILLMMATSSISEA